MIRRNARLRREYIYSKNLTNAAQKKADEDEATKNDTENQDNEYARAGIIDPRVFITTSRDPSSRLQQFAKELKLVFPNSQKLNRGGYVMKDLVNACRTNDVTDLIIVHEHRGEPDGLIVCHFPYGPTAYFGIHNTVLRHDIGERAPIAQEFPHLIFNQFSTKLGERTQDILKYLFPVPKEDSKRIVTFANQNDFISFRHHIYQREHKTIDLKELGPRFELKLYQVKLGTVDSETADNEWVFHP